MVLVRDVIERLTAAGQLPASDQLVGVPTGELNAWERELGLELPIDYRSFMALAGATTEARLFRGSGFFWPAPVGLRHAAQLSLEPDEYEAIPNEALFILEHQGYVFVWIDTSDPASPVYVSQEVDVDFQEVKRIADSFREWMLLALNE